MAVASPQALRDVQLPAQAITVDAVFDRFAVGPRGLTAQDASARLVESGPNVLPEPHRQPLWVRSAARFARRGIPVSVCHRP